MKAKKKSPATVTLGRRELRELARAVEYAMAMEMEIADKRGPLTKNPLTARYLALEVIASKLREASK